MGNVSDKGEDISDELSINPTLTWEKIKEKEMFKEIIATYSNNENKEEKIRFVTISDTHGKHRDCVLPDGDVLIHAGDFSNTGEKHIVQDFHDWFSEQNYKYKIVIGGNHDITFHSEFYSDEKVVKRFHRNLKEPYIPIEIRNIFLNSKTIIYLEDQAFDLPLLNSLKIYGTPWQPEFNEWAFNLMRGKECRDKWALIPYDTDILISHGPPLGRGDLVVDGERSGCVDLLRRVSQVHLFGHVHEGYGVSANANTTFINASSCTFNYRCTNPAIVFDISKRENAVKKVEIIKSKLCNWTSDDVKKWLESEDGPNFEKEIMDKLKSFDGSRLNNLKEDDIPALFSDVPSLAKIRAQIDFILKIRRLSASLMK